MDTLQNRLRISRVLHAGYLFESQQQGEPTRILFDPIFENPFSFNCFAYPNVQFDLNAIRQLQLSAIFISHYHDDHCSLESLQQLSKTTPVFLYCVHQELFEMIRKLGFTDVRALRVDQTETVGPFSITPRRALDDRTDTIFEITTSDCKILNVVDAQLDAETVAQLAKSAPWDLVLWPFQVMRESEVLAPTRVEPDAIFADAIVTDANQESRLSTSSQQLQKSTQVFPTEWTEQLQRLQPRAVVPSSCQFIHEEWSWYRNFFFSYSYREFQNYLAQILPLTKVTRLNPGCALEWAQKQFQPTEPLPWITPVGPQDVDYKLSPEQPIPDTSAIAQKFPALSPLQLQRILLFCKSEIIKRYQLIGPPEDIYFQKPRLWRLSIFDHLGQPSHFYYQLRDEEMTVVKIIDVEITPITKSYVTDSPNSADQLKNIAWTTEISTHKLYSALENGESLSSLYLRINAHRFSEKIEGEMREVNHLDDPLLRALYNGDALSYHRAQLKRLQKS